MKTPARTRHTSTVSQHASHIHKKIPINIMSLGSHVRADAGGNTGTLSNLTVLFGMEGVAQSRY